MSLYADAHVAVMHIVIIDDLSALFMSLCVRD